MADSPLIIKLKEFALLIIKVCNYVKQTKKESVLTNQLIRSGTSVGANIREAFYGHGTADFIAKLQISLVQFNLLQIPLVCYSIKYRKLPPALNDQMQLSGGPFLINRIS